MFKVGRVAIKVAGRDAGKHSVIVDKIDNNFVLIDGNVKRKRCNIDHLEPLSITLDIKKGASTKEVHNAMEKAKLKVIKTKPRKKTERPRKKRGKKKLEVTKK